MNFTQVENYLRNYRSGKEEFPYDPVGALSLLAALLENIDDSLMHHEFEEYSEVLNKKHKVTLSRLLYGKSEAAWPFLIDLKKIRQLVFDQWEEFPYDHSRKNVSRELLEESLDISVLEYNPVNQQWKVILDTLDNDSDLLRFSPMFVVLNNEVIKNNLSAYFHRELVSNTKLYLKPRKKKLPEFSKVVVWLWEDHESIDTDGDSFPLDSKEWRALRMRNTNKYDEKVMITSISEDPLVLQIVGGVEREIIWRTAYFLSHETDAEISNILDFRKTWKSEDLKKSLLMKGFDVEAAFKRTDEWDRRK